MRAIGEHSDNIDVLALMRQPQRWGELLNPMALLPHQTSINECPLMKIVAGATPAERISNSFRRRLKGKERKLQALPGYRYFVATEDADIKRSWTRSSPSSRCGWRKQKLPQRVRRLPHRGVHFAKPAWPRSRPRPRHRYPRAGMRRRNGRDLCRRLGWRPVLDDVQYLHDVRQCPLQPGLILMRDIVDSYAERGYTSIDLGIGADEYKRLFCKDDEPIFDSFLPVSTRGKVAATVMSSVSHAKRLVKADAGADADGADAARRCCIAELTDTHFLGYGSYPCARQDHPALAEPASPQPRPTSSSAPFVPGLRCRLNAVGLGRVERP